jgi:hypothetical protein
MGSAFTAFFAAAGAGVAAVFGASAICANAAAASVIATAVISSFSVFM